MYGESRLTMSPSSSSKYTLVSSDTTQQSSDLELEEKSGDEYLRQHPRRYTLWEALVLALVAVTCTTFGAFIGSRFKLFASVPQDVSSMTGRSE